MSSQFNVAAFIIGAVVSLATSWLLVTRIERIGDRIGASEAMLGLLAALAADAPEISSAVSALSQHRQAVGVGVTLGSNVFNLAALLGLGTLVAGRIALHRRVVLLEGAVAIWTAVVALLSAVHVVMPVAALALVLVVLLPYIGLSTLASPSPTRRVGRGRIERWLRLAIHEEELELFEAIHPRRGRPVDVSVALVALVVVVGASVTMEHAAATLGRRWGVGDIVIGTLVLAAVTSLPNAVAGVYLARRGRGAALLSVALNSNAINVTAGLLVPATILGIGSTTAGVVLVAAFYLAVTVITIAFAFADGGLRRPAAAGIIGAYIIFVLILVAAPVGG